MYIYIYIYILVIRGSESVKGSTELVLSSAATYHCNRMYTYVVYGAVSHTP